MGEWEGVASQGGFAVLAAFAIGVSYKIYQQADKLLNRAIDAMVAISVANANLAATMGGKIDNLTGEIQGLRTITHAIANAADAFPAMEIRLARLEEIEAERKEKRKDEVAAHTHPPLRRT